MPVAVMLLAIWFGLLYNNKRLDDFKDLLRAEINASNERILRAIERAESGLRADLVRLDRRVERLEQPLVKPS